MGALWKGSLCHRRERTADSPRPHRGVSGYIPPQLLLMFRIINGVSLPPLCPTDCDSYCKASKGKLKINMKKYCKKDYGERSHPKPSSAVL